jgi:hypothetical protein
MVHQNKNNTFSFESVSQTVTHLGFAAMLAATVVGMADLAERESHKAVAVLQPQPVYAFANDQNDQPGRTSQTANYATEQGGDAMYRRGGKEEIHHMASIYGSFGRSLGFWVKL